MFGHDTHHDENNLPEPDEHAAGNTTTADTGAGDYLDDVSPTAASGSTPVVTAPTNDNTGLANDTAAAPVTDADTSATTVPATPAVPAVAPADSDKLLDIKQQALQQLTPLVGHLEQSPEEKFRTTMMMIQASDNHELVPVAYEAAQQIPDEKVRAQALLDIVNEINYFTHNSTPAAA